MASLKVNDFVKFLVTTGVHRAGTVRAMATFAGEFGSGSGKGGGSGGSIRDAGGAMGKREAVQEEQYFRKKQAEQLAALHDHLEDEIRQHEVQIKLHEEAIKRSKAKLEASKRSTD
ncbi:ATPase inhibitor, mitochondrial-like [Varroa jacobsoni]|uniref:ATPase inhibitor, mitochondrial-like n=1 Tax=Varroa jacobsoni TaxID=62625 RepID=UPI000BF83A4A|nr:ATPase inhibitor, mitochondrial-like [Varroa jacobsoni]